jgi:hypothetical protein
MSLTFYVTKKSLEFRYGALSENDLYDIPIKEDV